MANNLFNVGDLVEILDGRGFLNYGPGWVPEMDELVGEVASVTDVINRGSERPWYKLSLSNYSFDEDGLKLYEELEIPKIGNVLDLLA